MSHSTVAAVSRFITVPLLRARTETIRDVRTHYLEAGEPTRPTVVLIHGGTPFSSAAVTWPETLPALGASFHVVAPDLISFGSSDRPPIAYSFQTLVDHLAAILDTLNVGPVHLAGQSTGAYVAAKYACDYPDRVGSLALINTSTVAQAMGLQPARQTAGQGARRAFDGSELMTRRLLETLFHRHELITDELVARCVAQANMPGLLEARASLDQYRARLRERPEQEQLFSLRFRLPVLQIPMALIWGEADRFAATEELDGLRRLLPKAHYFSVPAAGHFSFRDQPETVNALLEDFFRGAAVSRGAQH